MITLEDRVEAGGRFRPKEAKLVTSDHAEAVKYYQRSGIKGAALTRMLLDLLVEKHKEDTGRV